VVLGLLVAVGVVVVEVEGGSGGPKGHWAVAGSKTGCCPCFLCCCP